jgi:uncharacterized protein (DUF1330 family)
MKANRKIGLAVLLGVLIGAAGSAVIHARQASPLPGYVFAEVEVTDPAMFQKYAAQVEPSLAPFGGHYIVRRGKLFALEGDVPKLFTVIAFDSAQKAQDWYNSPAYAAIKGLRISATKSRLFIGEGLPAK